MTVIAWDKKTLACDSQITANGHRRSLGTAQKIIVAGPEDRWVIENKVIQAFGFAGRYSSLPLIKAALTACVWHDTKLESKEYQFSILAIAEDGSVFHWQAGKDPKKNEERSDLTPVTGCFAIGSGAVFAEGVLGIGLDSVTAVKAAIKMDVMSGGNIQVWEAWKGNLDAVIMINEHEERSALMDRFIMELKETLNQPYSTDAEMLAQLEKMKDILAKPEYEVLH